MSFGLAALFVAGLGAGWLLWRVSRGGAGNDSRNLTLLKFIVWLGLASALFAAKLWPLAFMVLLAAGGVMAIETWRAKSIEGDGLNAPGNMTPAAKMTIDEAASVLGLTVDAGADDIRAAHRKLISQIHPDKGGTDYLAGKINEARDTMLKRLDLNQASSG